MSPERAEGLVESFDVDLARKLFHSKRREDISKHIIESELRIIDLSSDGKRTYSRSNRGLPYELIQFFVKKGFTVTISSKLSGPPQKPFRVYWVHISWY